MRAEGQLVFDAVREAAAIARRGEVHAHVSHLKLEGRGAWGRTDELLALIDTTGVTADQYPYVAWESSLASSLPAWAPVDRLRVLLADPAARARLVRIIEEGEPDWESSVADFGWESIVLEATDASLADRDVASVAAERDVAPVDLALDLLCRDPDVRARGQGMHEDDVRAVLARPDILVASDGIAVSPEGPLWGTPLHPRSYGTFPRVLGRYVRDGALLSLEAAVRKMTALPAETFGLSGRGVIAEGAVADLVLFDPRPSPTAPSSATPTATPRASRGDRRRPLCLGRRAPRAGWAGRAARLRAPRTVTSTRCRKRWRSGHHRGEARTAGVGRTTKAPSQEECQSCESLLTSVGEGVTSAHVGQQRDVEGEQLEQIALELADLEGGGDARGRALTT